MKKTLAILLLVLAAFLASCAPKFTTYSDGAFSVDYPAWKAVAVPNANAVVNVVSANCAVRVDKIKIGPLGFEGAAKILLQIAKNSGSFVSISEDITASYANIDYKVGVAGTQAQVSLKAKNCGENAYAVSFSCKETQFQKNSNLMNQVFGSMKC
ncbi:MAG TPA: hypothetical protein VJI46_06695 [Candidatus Nanoarchaeia archaeon]|nr:hypothetical protein [Candidatus Nanoarchaeia archaeon]